MIRGLTTRRYQWNNQVDQMTPNLFEEKVVRLYIYIYCGDVFNRTYWLLLNSLLLWLRNDATNLTEMNGIARIYTREHYTLRRSARTYSSNLRLRSRLTCNRATIFSFLSYYFSNEFRASHCNRSVAITTDTTWKNPDFCDKGLM